MDIRDAVRAIEFIKPAKVIPMHYDTFPPIKADPKQFVDLVGKKAEVIVLAPGESF
jgi:L-ascorbate metabolism protein UlaG (beta-lactamase superfamily)